MKERELRAVATCAIHGGKIGDASSPVFYRVRVEQWTVHRSAVLRQAGLEMMMGGSVALAQALGPDEDMATLLAEPVTLTVCAKCAVTSYPLAALLSDAIAAESATTEPEAT